MSESPKPSDAAAVSLSSRQVKYLRGLTHSLQPVVIVADKGLTENVLAEIDSALERHELVKIKLRSDRETRSEWIRSIGQSTGAAKVHTIGQVAPSEHTHTHTHTYVCIVTPRARTCVSRHRHAY